MTFKSLVNVVSEQRQEIKQALTLFPYFETWNPDLVAECCRVSSVVEFPPDKIILGLDTGNSHAVYFILEGVCKMIQNLFVHVQKISHNVSKKELYKLHKYFPSKLNFELKNEDYISRLFNQSHHLQKQIISENESHYEKAESLNISKEFANDKMKKTGDIKLLHTEVPSYKTGIDDDGVPEMNNENHNTAVLTNKNLYEEIFEKEKNPITGLSNSLKSQPLIESQSEKIQVIEESKLKKEAAFDVDHHVMVLRECKKRREDMIRGFKKATLFEKPENTECFFMEIGFLLRGACFGLEKPGDKNFIMTETIVKCLEIPRQFLLQHNPCNIWNRIRLFHSLHLPKEEQIFEYFMADRKWMKRKKKQTADIISLKNLPHYTSASEVPYSIRFSQLNDDLFLI